MTETEYLELHPDAVVLGMTGAAHFKRFGQRLTTLSDGQHKAPNLLVTGAGQHGKEQPEATPETLNEADNTRLTFIPIPTPAELATKGKRKYFNDDIISPPVTIIVACEHFTLPFLAECVASILAQSNHNWELILVCDGSPNAPARGLLESFQSQDTRVRAIFQPSSGHISEAINDAIKNAPADFLAFIDPTTTLLPDALEVLMSQLMTQNADAVYCDHEILAPDKYRKVTISKPSWSPALLTGMNYLGPVFVVRKRIARSVGLFDPTFLGCQCYDFALRVGEYTRNILHVPIGLYEQRPVFVNDSEASRLDGLRCQAVNAHFARTGFSGMGVLDEGQINQADSRPVRIVPKSKLGSIDIDVIVQGGADAEITLLREKSSEQGLNPTSLRVVDWLNSPRTCVALGHAPLILFLDPRVRFLSDEWVHFLLMYARCLDVAFVTSNTYAPDGAFLSGGLVATPQGLQRDKDNEEDDDTVGCHPFLLCDREVSALGSTCTLIARERLNTIGGLSRHYVSCEGAVSEASWRSTLEGMRNICVATKFLECPRPLSPSSLNAAIDAQFFVDDRRLRCESADRMARKFPQFNRFDLQAG